MFFGLVTLFVALSISAVAAYYSIVGLMAIFSAAAFSSDVGNFPTSGVSTSAGTASVATGAVLGFFRGINKNSSSTSSSFAKSKSS